MKIPPKFSITPAILNLLAKIEAGRTLLTTLEIPSELKIKIQRKSLLKSSLFSAKIEGNPLTLEEMKKTGQTQKKKEVFNLVSASKFIDQYVKTDEPLSLKSFLKLHELVMKEIGVSGFRTEPGAIFNMAGVAVYFSPPPSEIKELLKSLTDFVNSDHGGFPLVTALLSHLVFEKIHPFIDGNGRVGRLLISLILKSKNYSFGLTIPFEKFLDDHRDEYYYHLDHGLKETEAYLIFMLEAVYKETQNLIEEITNTGKEDKKISLLPLRQEEIFLIIKEHKVVSFDFLKRRFLKVPGRTLRYDLKKLQEKGLILKAGVTRGSFYKMAPGV